ncbi:MAG TPA: DUF6599 family protein [Verrucomicrobiae bacterium]|jgi:hypothetical protein|nr:DUF6599 family protein [Verrucomicrobiae bacterium]
MKMDWKIVPIVWLTLSAARLNAQALTSPATGPSANVPNTTQLPGLLRPPLPGRAVLEGAPSTYSADSLYQYIDGGAEIYLLYDFQTLLHQELRSVGAEVTVDIYEMGNPEDSFGIYSSERSTNYKFLPIGAEGYRGQGTLNFLEGRYYVKLSGSGPNADALLGEFARLLSSRIGGSRTLPALLDKLPREHRIAHSEQFIKKDPLGHAFLAPAYLVTYAEGKQEMKLVVSVANSAAAAKARAAQLAKHFKQSGEATPALDLGENGMRGSNSFEGHVIARTHGHYLIALFNPGQNGAQILKATAQGLP